jgi:hypothetical protein
LQGLKPPQYIQTQCGRVKGGGSLRSRKAKAPDLFDSSLFFQDGVLPQPTPVSRPPQAEACWLQAFTHAETGSREVSVSPEELPRIFCHASAGSCYATLRHFCRIMRHPRQVTSDRRPRSTEKGNGLKPVGCDKRTSPPRRSQRCREPFFGHEGSSVWAEKRGQVPPLFPRLPGQGRQSHQRSALR